MHFPHLRRSAAAPPSRPPPPCLARPACPACTPPRPRYSPARGRGIAGAARATVPARLPLRSRRSAAAFAPSAALARPPPAPRAPPAALGAPCRPAARRTGRALSGRRCHTLLPRPGAAGQPGLAWGGKGVQAGPGVAVAGVGIVGFSLPRSSYSPLWTGEDNRILNLKCSEPNLRDSLCFHSLPTPHLSNNSNNLHLMNISYVPACTEHFTGVISFTGSLPRRY